MVSGQTNQALFASLCRAGLRLDTDYLGEALQIIVQAFMDIEVSHWIAAGLYERKPTRRAYRNGYRPYLWKTSLGDLALRIPKLRKGAYFPHFLEDAALEETLRDWIHTAFLAGVSLDSIRHLRGALDLASVHPSLLADLAEQMHDLIERFRAAPLDQHIHNLVLFSLPLQNGQAAALGVGIDADGTRRLLAMEMTVHQADRAYWDEFVQRLQARGLRTIDRLISPDDLALGDFAAQVFRYTTWRTLDPRITLSALPESAGLVAMIEQLVDQDALVITAGLRHETPQPRLSIIGQLQEQPLALAA